MGYNIRHNQCSQVVQKALKSGGVNVEETRIRIVDPQINMSILYKDMPYFPSKAFGIIMKNKPNGIYEKK